MRKKSAIGVVFPPKQDHLSMNRDCSNELISETFGALKEVDTDSHLLLGLKVIPGRSQLVNALPPSIERLCLIYRKPTAETYLTLHSHATKAHKNLCPSARFCSWCSIQAWRGPLFHFRCPPLKRARRLDRD